MIRVLAWSLFTILPITLGQQVGQPPEIHPKLATQKCTRDHGCIPQKTSVVLDAQWRDLTDVQTGTSCLTSSGSLNKTICSTADECAQKCALSRADYAGTGVETHGKSVTLRMYQHYQGETVAVGPQIYLLDEQNYHLLHLLNQEVSFDVDASNLPCGMNGAMYLAAMDADGGRSQLNPAGAAYGTGYSDSQCYPYNFINGVANLNDLGACCNEMDLWEANARATQLTPHPCNLTGVYACSGDECDGGRNGVCDNVGCGFNPYGLGAHQFYGLRGVVDTSKPFRVVTQFHADSSTGALVEIRRLYIQESKVIKNAAITLYNRTFDSITSDFCRQILAKSFRGHGGLEQIGEALARGMTLVMGIWNVKSDFLNWLDAGQAGPCNKKEGNPALIRANDPGTRVTFSDIRWGDIGSTCRF